MLQIAVCDDEVIECCNMAKRIKEIMEEIKSQNRREFMKIFSRPPSTDSLRICQT